MIILSILGLIAVVALFIKLDKSGGCCRGSCEQGRKECDCEDK